MVHPAMTHYFLAGVNKPMQSSNKHEDEFVHRFVVCSRILILPRPPLNEPVQ